MLFFTMLLLFSTLSSQEVVVNLKDPIYSDGVLETTAGGTLTTQGLKVQAKHLIYRKSQDTECITAEGQLMVLFEDQLFVGEKLTYNFTTRFGIIEGGRGALFPWYFGAKTIYLLKGGEFQVVNAFFTTSENKEPEWGIQIDKATLFRDNTLDGCGVRIKMANTTLFWFPRFKTNLDFIFDNPMRTYFRAGGKRGSRFGVTYKLYTKGPFELFGHLDWRLFRGPGGGFETRYLSQDKTLRFNSISYVARDTSIENPTERLRYRFQGSYHNILKENNMTINLTYDKLSDRYMATDYIDTTLKFIVPERTELQIRKQNDFFITNFWTRVRVNQYQSLKQELPFLETRTRPINLFSTPIIFEQSGSIGYLDYNYSEKLCEKNASPLPGLKENYRDFDSFRLSYTPSLLATFSKGITITPQAQGIFIYYQKTPLKNPEFLATAFIAMETNLFFYKEGFSGRHIVKPYMLNEWVIEPTASPSSHYIFDINDGWSYLNTTRLGIKQWFFQWDKNRYPIKSLEADLFTYLFIDTNTFPNHVPRVYGNLIYQMTPFLRQTFETAWDLIHQEVAHFNAKLEWTKNQNTALSLEYRHRNAYDFRKVDYFNFILESYRTENQLVHSTLSDRRDTCLFHLYSKFHPEWALELNCRCGWLRICEPNYLEYEVALNGTLKSAWNVRLAYQHVENDHRFVFGLSLGLKKPNSLK